MEHGVTRLTEPQTRAPRFRVNGNRDVWHLAGHIVKSFLHHFRLSNLCAFTAAWYYHELWPQCLLFHHIPPSLCPPETFQSWFSIVQSLTEFAFSCHCTTLCPPSILSLEPLIHSTKQFKVHPSSEIRTRHSQTKRHWLKPLPSSAVVQLKTSCWRCSEEPD